MTSNRQRLAMKRLRALGPIIARPITPEEQADYERRQAAVYAAMDARVEAANPRREI